MPYLDRPLPPLTEASVAVLPLRNLSGYPGDDQFCAGIAADITIDLSRFRDLLVIARHSAFFVDSERLPACEVGERLGVRYLLTGEFKRSECHIRLRVKLADAQSGKALWMDSYEGDLEEIFAFQDDITELVAGRLAAQIRLAEDRRLSERPPDILAYRLNLRGRELTQKYEREANGYAQSLYEQALNLDPCYGRSYAGLSRTFNLDAFYGWTDRPELALERALECAKLATQYDSFDARSYAELGYAYLYSRRHEESLAAYEHAIALNPNDADILSDRADALILSGGAERGIELLKRAMRLNPCYPDDYLWHLGGAYFCLGDYAKTIETLEEMQEPAEAHRLLAASHALVGNRSQASYHAKEVMRAHPNFSIEHWQRVPPYKEGGTQLETFIAGLRMAGLT